MQRSSDVCVIFSRQNPFFFGAVTMCHMGEPLSRKVHDAARRYGLLRPGERVVVALSGGADSVALLLLLLDLRKDLGLALSVAHFNHKLRGKSSDADENFAAKLAEKHGLAFYVGRAD